MIRTQPASLAMAAFVSLTLATAPMAYSQQTASSVAGGGPSPTSAEVVKLCVPRDLVERDRFEQPAPGSKMDAFHNALRRFLLSQGDVRFEYQVRPNAFESFDTENVDPSALLQETNAVANCPDDDYSYSLPVKRANHSAAPDASPADARPPASESLYRGWQYQLGNGVPKDPAKAAAFYAEAAKQGNPDAMYRLALLYRDGTGVNQDSAAAVDLLYRAGRQGHAAAQMDLGFAYLLGNGVPRDDVTAFRWLQLAAQGGAPGARAALGAMYQTGRGVTRNESEASAWFQKAAAQGQMVGMFELGQSLRLGRGIGRDEQEAVQWYQKSANAGYIPAQAELGYCYQVGVGVAQNYRLAAQWLTQAARQGEPYAQLNLAALYVDGTGVDRNLAEARALYAQAANGPVPEVAARAKELAATLPEPANEALPGRPANSSSNASAVLKVAAVALGAVLVFSLLSNSSSRDAAAAPPINGSSSLAGSFGGDSPSTSTVQRVTAFPGPPPPHPCVGNTGAILNGTAGLGFDNVCR
jgi:TPR repeat protein